MAATTPLYRNMDRFFIQLKAGERLTLSAALQKRLRATPQEAERLLRVDRPKIVVQEYVLEPSDVKHEDDHLLVVFKRSGVPTQPTP